MAKEFTGRLEVFEVHDRILRNGNRIRIVLEAPYDKSMDRRLIDFKRKTVDVKMTISEEQGSLFEEPAGDEEEEEQEEKQA